MLLIKNKVLRKIWGMIETLNLLTFRLFLKNPARWNWFPGKIFREYMALVENDTWACRDIFAILPIPDGTRITLEHIPGHGIIAPVEELAYLALLTKAIRPKAIFEIGTFRGRTALNFALNSPPDCTVWTLDLPPQAKPGMEQQTGTADSTIIKAASPGADYQGKDVAHKIKQLLGDSLDFDYSPYEGKMDLVFVDGAHHFEAVQADTRTALRLARPGGWIVWHDFANYGDYHDVTRAILSLLPGDKVIQVSNTQLAVFQKN